MSSSPNSALVEQLKELGISERSARYALSKTGNDVHRAANYESRDQRVESRGQASHQTCLRPRAVVLLLLCSAQSSISFTTVTNTITIIIITPEVPSFGLPYLYHVPEKNLEL
ncbi:hypothetical protein IAT40_003627 [Kwoniella sp. CBS 6097]